MFFIAIQFNNLFEVAILLFGALVLGFAVHFFIVSRKSLKETLQATATDTLPRTVKAPKKQMQQERSVSDLFRPLMRSKAKAGGEEVLQLAIPARTKSASREDSVENLKETILQQQKLLNGFLRQVEEIENEGKEELALENKHLQGEIRTLELQLQEKEADLEETRKQAEVADRMAARIEEVYQEFEQLQAKMVLLEKQASRANNLALELEDTREAYEQIHKDLQRKNEKVEELFSDNQRFQQQLNLVEDKLAEANLQRQQLQKKVQFLQDLNSDLQSMSDTNKKLQTELRRIGELESMLSMISEERDYLLRRSGK